MKELKLEYQNICENICNKFAEITGLDFEGWANDDVGDTVTFSDYFLNFNTVTDVVFNEISEDVFFLWYDYNIKNGADYYVNITSYNGLINTVRYYKGLNFDLNNFHEYLKIRDKTVNFNEYFKIRK